MTLYRKIATSSLVGMLAIGMAACSGKQQPAAEAPAAAPPVNQNVHQFSIGGMTGFALRDGGVEFPNDNSVLGVGRTPEEVAAVLSAGNLPTDKVSLSLQPLLVKLGGRVLLFDTGAGTAMGEGAGHLLAAMEEAGVKPSDVTDVFISHLHADHVGGLIDAEGNRVFTNATIRISETEWETLKGLNARTAANFGLPNHKQIEIAIGPDAAPFKVGGDVLPGLVRSVDVKGHTPGHSAFRIGTGSSALLYIGDAMHHHLVSVQKPEWKISFDSNGDVGAASRASLLEELATSNQRIYAVHFPFPGIGRIQKTDSGYTWVPEK